ncbi:tRNA (guanine(9)-N(1))-methyltransferase [Ascosphaera pollenicola]|nr:tRNA (guanine(9)-N(1))-methyltransferase [Ascosphaera pollenicola]
MLCRQSLMRRRAFVAPSSLPFARSISLQNQSVHPFKVPPWRPGSILDGWAERDVRPVSLRQLLFFGRALTETRLLSAANYVRTELPTRIAHRLREMQKLPYVVVTNPRLSHVYELYYTAFERLRKVPEIKTLNDNDNYCDVLKKTLREHLTAIPNLMMGVLECEHLVDPDDMDKFMNTLLRARISRRVIAEQHLALTETFNSPWHFPGDIYRSDIETDYVGEILLKCNTKTVIDNCGTLTREFFRREMGTDRCLPDIIVRGHLDATFPYIQSHLEYILGELLRNSMQAVTAKYKDASEKPPPIEVLICESAQHVIIRVSDQGGGVPRETLPTLWSFCKAPRNGLRLQNLGKVPAMAATIQELRLGGGQQRNESKQWHSSLSTLTSRPPNLRLGMGLPMSRVFAEYWAGSLELHSLEGYGVDAFLQISKLGNKNEQLTTRASIDAV